MIAIQSRYALAGFASLIALASSAAANAADQRSPSSPNGTNATAQAKATTTSEVAANSSDEYAIVVTARRKEENLQDVPVAISVLGDAVLQRENIVDAADLGGAVPGLVVGNSLGGGRSTPTFAIRGQSQQELSGIADPSVSLYINDIAVPRAQGSNTGFFDLAGVEVANGPQGTLFGRNTTGGAIIIRTRRPENNFDVYIMPTIGNYGLFSLEGMINIPVNQKIALRVAGLHYERGGYLKDVLSGRDINTINEDAIRGSLLLEPTDGLKNETMFQYSNTDNGGTGGYITFSLNPLFQPGLARRAGLGFYQTESGIPMFAKGNTYHLDNTTSVELTSQLTFKNIFGYRDMNFHNMEDLDGSSDVLFPVERIVDQHQISNEIQLQGNFGKFDFILGGFYFRENGQDQALTTGPLAGIAITDPGRREPDSIGVYSPRYSNTWVGFTNTSYAVFFQGNYRLTDSLTATAGIRQNWDKREANIYNRAYISSISTTGLSCRFTLDADNNPATPETRPSIDKCRFHGTKKFNEPTYNLSLQFSPADKVLTYIAHRHGYRSGGFGARGNSQATLGDTFEPEKVDDFEVGVKADWRIGDMFLRTNVAAYSAKYKDMQRILYLTEPNSPPVTLTTNAGRAKIEGVEFEGIFRPVDMVELSGFYTYTHARFNKYIGPNGDDLSHQVFPRAPKHSYSITASLMPPIPATVGELRLNLTYRYQSRYDYNDDYALEHTLAGVAIPTGVAYNRAQIIEAQKLMNASIELNKIFGSNVDASVFVDNLTNRKYLIPYMGISGVYETRTPAAPRMFGVRFRARFE